MAFHAGQRVVCVRDDWRSTPTSCGRGYLPPLCPRAGVEYVVRTVEPVDDGSGQGLRFHWLVNPKANFANGLLEPSFGAAGLDGVMNFRPVVELKTETGVAILRKVAKDASKKRVLTVARTA